ncbi:MAG: protein translocase subunit SecD [Gammaproteobacteria bacterium]|nr:protein translocase subunit SecD [Gammaproteobacteria bacterium]
MNRNPSWKYLLLVMLVAFGVIYATPNLYVAEPGVQVIGVRDVEVDQGTLSQVANALDSKGIEIKSISLEGDAIKARLMSEADQSNARDALKQAMGTDYGVALADMPTTPGWLASLGAAPMYLGLDLRGGVHFLLQVDMDAAQQRAEENYVDDLKKLFQDDKIRYLGVNRTASSTIEMKFRDAEIQEAAAGKTRLAYPELSLVDYSQGDRFYLRATLSDQGIADIRNAALKKNMIAIRNRIDQLGVSEPIIQQQGSDRIVVQLPGVKDPAEAKNILGKTATLEVRLVDEDNELQSTIRGRVPVGSKRYFFRDGRGILLKRRLILSGENIVDATSGFDSQSGGPVVNITLDGKGASIWRKVTGDNINKRMAVVYVENSTETTIDAQGEEKLVRTRIEEVITAPVIRDQLGKRFIITGLDSPKESQDLALLLRAGSLAAPVYIVEERTIGPSLGKDNIEKGFKSVLYGFLAVLLFMIVYYRVFGGIASFALVMNLVIIVGVLSLLQATLTLPGVAGMVLTVGMAVDANVLIFERIREEVLGGSSPQMAIHRGYDNAFSTIIDANLTTLIAALVLFNFGTGPIQGFAITLSIGIVTSMITAIFVSRILVNLIYGKRRLESLAI